MQDNKSGTQKSSTKRNGSLLALVGIILLVIGNVVDSPVADHPSNRVTLLIIGSIKFLGFILIVAGIVAMFRKKQ